MLDFSDVLEKALRAAAADGRVLAEPLSASNRAITTSSSTSSRTPAARSGSWCRCSSRPGVKGSASRPIRRSSSSAIGSSRSTGSATPTSRVLRAGRRVHRRAATGGPRPPLDRAQLPRRARPAALRQRRLHGDVAAGRRTRASFTYDERDRFPVDAGARRGRRIARAGARAGGRRNAGRVRRGGRRRNRSDPRRLGDGPGQGDRHRAPGPARRHRHPVPVALEPPRVRARAERARHPDLRLQGTRASSTPTRSRTSSR